MKELDYLTQKIKYEQDYLLQDYFRIALKDREWKSEYELIVKAGANNKFKRNKYKAAYINIREYGIDKIDIESFDVTLSAAFYEDINNEKFDLSDIYDRNVASTIRFIAMDRNYLSHLNGNEPLEDVITLLYGSLNSIKYLLDAVSWTDFDKEEVTAYIRKYTDRKDALAIEIDECYELCKKDKISEENRKKTH